MKIRYFRIDIFFQNQVLGFGFQGYPGSAPGFFKAMINKHIGELLELLSDDRTATLSLFAVLFYFLT